jgi:tetratricopeptide (TPR) repeat protein
MTRNAQKSVIFFGGIVLLLVLSSCSGLRKEQTLKEQVGNMQGQKQTEYVKKQAQMEIDGGNFQRAIDLWKEIYQKYPQNFNLRSGYIRTLESIKARGDRAFEGSDFALAGSVYEIVLRNLSSMRRLNGSLSFSREGLTAKIGNCKKTLFENGLEQYRSGNLNQAITLWKSILAFDPENGEIKRAVEMATFQFSNLQKTK